MALTGVLQADFQSFYDAVQKAEVQLRSFDAGAGKVESSLARMTDSFSGRRVIQDATLMAEAIERAGGISRLTANELQRAGTLAQEASAKMRALGIDVPERIQAVSTAARAAATDLEALGTGGGDAAPKVRDLHGALNQFDGALSAVGLHVGPEIRGLTELGAASGKTATEIGLLGTAGLALAAGIGGWKIGRLVADFFDLDEKIGNATAKLFHFGDVAAETAAAKADVLARASEHAGRTITDMNEAIRINAEAAKTAANTYTDWAGRMSEAQARLGELTPAQIKQIELAQKLGASQQQLTHDFGITADVLILLKDRVKEVTDAGIVWGEGAGMIKADLEALDAEAAALAAGGITDVVGALGTMITDFEALDPAMAAYIEQLQRADAYQKAMAEGLIIVGQAAEATAGKIEQTTLTFSQAMDAARRGEGTMSATVQAGGPFTASRAETQAAWNEGRYWGPVVGGTSSNPKGTGPDWSKLELRAQGGPVSAGGAYLVGEEGPELFTPRSGGMITPNGGGGSVTIVNHFGGMVGDTATLARVIQDALITNFKSLGYRGPVPIGG